MSKFQLEVNYNFKGLLTIEADTFKEAAEVALNSTGVTLSGGFNSNDNRVVDFDVPSGADKSIGRVRNKEVKNG